MRKTQSNKIFLISDPFAAWQRNLGIDKSGTIFSIYVKQKLHLHIFRFSHGVPMVFAKNNWYIFTFVFLKFLLVQCDITAIHSREDFLPVDKLIAYEIRGQKKGCKCALLVPSRLKESNFVRDWIQFRGKMLNFQCKNLMNIVLFNHGKPHFLSPPRQVKTNNPSLFVWWSNLLVGLLFDPITHGWHSDMKRITVGYCQVKHLHTYSPNYTPTTACGGAAAFD